MWQYCVRIRFKNLSNNICAHGYFGLCFVYHRKKNVDNRNNMFGYAFLRTVIKNMSEKLPVVVIWSKQKQLTGISQRLFYVYCYLWNYKRIKKILKCNKKNFYFGTAYRRLIAKNIVSIHIKRKRNIITKQILHRKY